MHSQSSSSISRSPAPWIQKLRVFSHPAILPIYSALFFLSFYWDVFITRVSIMTHDSIFWYGSFNYFLLCLAQFELPLWDPYSFSGTPFFLEFNGHAMLDPSVVLLVPLIWLGNFSVLDLFHWHYGALLGLYYAGTYALALHLAKNKWAALLGATLTLFVIGGNGFRQHGLWSSAVYSPLILLFLLKLISPHTSNANRKYFFLASCYLIGLSLNIYIPSYLFVFLSLAFLYLNVAWRVKKGVRFFLNNRKKWALKELGSIFIYVASFFIIGIVVLHGSSTIKLIVVPALMGVIIFFTLQLSFVRKIFSDIGLKNIFLGVALFAILTAPFFYSLSQILPSDAENFGYARANLDAKFSELAHLENDALSRPKETLRFRLDSLAGILFPFPDIRYFFGGRNMEEAVPVLGIIPLLIVFLFFKSSRSAYKGLCLFLVLSLGLIMGGPDILYGPFLKYFPGLWTVRAVANFLGYFYPIWAALIAICFTRLLGDKNSQISGKWGWIGLGVIGFLHAEGIYFYLTTFVPATTTKPYLMYIPWLEENFISHAWLLALVYGLVLVLLVVSSRSVRALCCYSLVFLSIFQVVEVCFTLRAFTIQPALYSDKGYVHYNRKFEYKPIRVPVPPRLGTFNSYIPALYRLPVVGPLYKGDYIIIGRRIYDYLRATSIENLGLVSGMGARRFGFFDRYIMARNSVDALMHVSGLPKGVLKNALVLEEPEFAGSLRHSERVRTMDLPPLNSPKENPIGILTTLYTDFSNINFLYIDPPKEDNFLRKVRIPEKSPLLNWAWDQDHLGYFLVMTRHLNLHRFHRAFRISTFIPVSLDAGEKGDICFSLFQQNGLYEDRDSKLSIEEQYPYYCALRIQNGTLVVNEKYWSNVTNNGTFNRKELAPAYPGVTLWGLNPGNVTPDRSPYARDEDTEVLDFGPNHIRFKITNSKAGLFYYADSYSKHWKAWIDGEPTQILRANFNFKAVSVDEGEHIVEFRFEPSLFIFFMISAILISIPGMILPVIALRK